MPRSRYLVNGMPRRYDNHKHLTGARFREHYLALEETYGPFATELIRQAAADAAEALPPGQRREAAENAADPDSMSPRMPVMLAGCLPFQTSILRKLLGNKAKISRGCLSCLSSRGTRGKEGAGRGAGLPVWGRISSYHYLRETVLTSILLALLARGTTSYPRMPVEKAGIPQA